MGIVTLPLHRVLLVNVRKFFLELLAMAITGSAERPRFDAHRYFFALGLLYLIDIG